MAGSSRASRGARGGNERVVSLSGAVARGACAAALVGFAWCGAASAQLRELQLTFEPFDHVNPVWGPDLPPVCDERGDYFAYQYTDENGRQQLAARQFKFGGGIGEPLLLTDPSGPADNCEPQFAPSGEYVIFVRQMPGEPPKIYRIDFDSNSTAFPDQIPVAVGDAEHRNPRISPDGNVIAYEKKRPGDATWQIWTYCVTCGIETMRTFDRRQDHYGVAWAPNSASFVFARTIAGPGTAANLFRYDVTTVRLRALTSDAGPRTYVDPSWTIDDVEFGQYVLAVRGIAPNGPFNVVQVNQNGSLLVEQLTGRTDGLCENPRTDITYRAPFGGPQNSRKILVEVKDLSTDETHVARILNGLLDLPQRCPLIHALTRAGATNARWDPTTTNAIYQKKVGEHWQIFILDSVF